MRFYGNQIHCGSYACLNAMKDSSIDPSLFEASTATPFGIKHYENQNFDRLLTTLCDPNMGLDNALRLWGYSVSKKCFPSSSELVQYMKETLPEKRRVVIGPIDMGKLRYQAVPDIVRRMDHYIVLESSSDTQVLCIDSEGFYGYRMEYDLIENCISIEEIPEAKNRITLRYIEKTSEYSRVKIFYHTLIRAVQQLSEAEAIGQGSNAIYQCCNFLQEWERDLGLWKLSFLYDLQYLMQRKNLFWWFLCEFQKIHTGSCVEDLKTIISSQKELLGRIYFVLRWKNYLVYQDLYQLGDLEKELSKVASLIDI